MSKLPRVIIATQGVSPVVTSVAERFDLVGLIETGPRHVGGTKHRVRKLLLSVSGRFSPGHRTLQSFAKARGIPYFWMEKGNDDALKSWVRDRCPDVMVVSTMNHLLKREIFEIPRHGTLNLHCAGLPEFRGPQPWFWQYFHFRNEGGVTLHFVDDGEDSGDIVFQESFAIVPGMRLKEMIDLSSNRIGVRLILNALDNIDNLPRTKQPRRSPTERARRIRADEHMSLIDWNAWDIKHVWHVLRGTETWLNAIRQPGGIYSGQRWEVGDYEKLPMTGYVPSELYRENGRRFVACRDGKIHLSVTLSLRRLLLNLTS
jgi:methionyl-tRNA formyltransferase